MTRRGWWALALLAVLGCSRQAAPGADIREPDPSITALHDPPPPSARPPSAPSSVASSPAPTSSAAWSAPPAPPFVLTELSPAQGELTPLLRAHAARAREKHLVPLVEVYADWCPPCRAFQASLTDPRMIEALRGTSLVKLNLDDWHDKLPGTGFAVPTIPTFSLVGADGRPAGKMLDGDKWGRPTPEIMAASLSKLLGR